MLRQRVQMQERRHHLRRACIVMIIIVRGTTRAQWEDVTGSTPLTFVNDCVSFTTTVSARFWLIDCRQVNEATKFATELYQEAIHVPFMSKFVVFAKRHDPSEAQLRVFCMTDDKEEKTLENQEHFTEVAKSRDVEVLENKAQFLEFAGNLIPVTKSGEQLSLTFRAFRENRLPFVMRVKDPNQDPLGRIAFMRENKRIRGSEATQQPICNLNIELPDICREDASPNDFDGIEKQYDLSAPGLKLSTGGVDQNGFDALKDDLGRSRTTSRGTSLGREVSIDVSYDEQDIMKEAESAEESGSEGGVKDHSLSADRGRSRTASEVDELKRVEESSEREAAAQKFLEFLEEQDREDSEERAKNRGEDSNLPSELFVVKEEMMIPLESSSYRDEPTEIRTTETTSILDDGTIKHTITAVTKTTVVQTQDGDEGLNVDPQRQLLESETWHSEQDTSQVSVSSLPEDEKSEPSTATVSSTTTTNTGDNIASALVTTSVEDEPHFDAIVEQKEWTEEDGSGCVQHIIEQTSTIITDERDPKYV
ncbi:unnamed protein product [Oppiella nova]|uniref:Ankyrin UPA domain-containing protein n=1 Tax=Oppiella nova TaxID=334625 RepID=A0A7R9LRH5_9ACAR|nr:unnamed protein product [Oppiella nova]CAG2165896.1 unnamed protein product [Oppiella nova]